ncbi:MAG: tetratricopeptide repeat protein [Planctomycetes bacterium]|nr:tetratricopeptide repeat protein [Planctomycetota bacterium]
MRALLVSLLFAAPLAADVDADYQSLLEAFKAKQYAQALDRAEKFVSANPEYKYSDAVHYMGGNAGLNAGEYARGEALYRALLKDHADSRHAGKARDELVTLLDADRRLTECIAQCEANLEAEPEGAKRDRWTYMIGQCRFRLWQFEQAEKDLKAFRKDFPKSEYNSSASYYLERINPALNVDADGIVSGYDGKFVKDIRYQTALKHLPGYVKDAWKILKRTLGVDLKGAQVVFEFKDKGFSRDSNRAYTETICVDYKPYTRMVFYAEHIVVSEEDFRSRVTHELKHAAFRDVMGAGYLDLPKWVREGLAVYGAEQFEDRLAALVGGETFSGRDPRKLLDGIADADHNTNDYLEDAAAFMWLESVKKGSVHEFCRRLLQGEDCNELFAKLSGKPLEEAFEAAAAYALQLVNDRLGDAEDEFLKIRSADFKNAKDKDWAGNEGIALYSDWLKTHAGHPLKANARYRLGKLLIRSGKYEEGRKCMRQVLEAEQLRSTICDDAQFWIAQSYEDEGEPEKAKREWGVLLRDYSWSRQAIDRKDRFAVAGPETGDSDK